MKKIALILLVLISTLGSAQAKDKTNAFLRFKPLIETIRLDNLEAFKKEFEKQNPDINESLNEFGTSTLNFAISYNSPKVFEYVLVNFSNLEINCQDIVGSTGLHLAAVSCNYQFFTDLVKYKADTTLENTGGYTPIELVEELCKENKDLLAFARAQKY